MRVLSSCCVVRVVALAGGNPALAADPAGPRRYALVVGVNAYDHANLGKLKYALNDAKELAALLRKDGYEVVELTDVTAEKPTRANVEAGLDGLLKKFRKGDTILICLAGHGLQYDDTDCFFCPRDAKPFKTETATMVSLANVYDKLSKAYAGTKLVLVDACRSDGGRGRGIDRAMLPPRGVGVLLSYSEGEKAFEHDDLKHGVFFHYVLEGLRGKAKDDRKGTVTWDSLRAYVKDEVSTNVPILWKEREQHPNALGNISGASPVLIGPRLAPDLLTAPFSEAKAKAAQEAWAAFLGRKVEEEADLGNGVRMAFRLVAPGKFQMGSPKEEKEHRDDEQQHWVTLTQSDGRGGALPYYLGKHEVTQGQWEQLMGTTLRQQRDKADKTGSLYGEGAEYRMYYVSHEEAMDFCGRLTECKAGRLAEGWEYRLPTEAQWEYGCRAGAEGPFHFGGVLNGKQANCDGTVPYGTDEKGPYLKETRPGGKYDANGWGLYDMHGNVWEWCLDRYGKYSDGATTDPSGPLEGPDRVIRGGSWRHFARFCRSAYRIRSTPGDRRSILGFRVARVPSGSGKGK